CQGRISGEAVLLDDGFERAFFAVVAELDAFHVVRDRAGSRGYLFHLVGRNKEELSLWVHELLDEPGAGHAINLHPLSRHPFHGMSLFLDQCPSWFSQWLSCLLITKYKPAHAHGAVP